MRVVAAFPQFLVPYSLSHMQPRNFLLIQCEKSVAAATSLSEVKVQLHVYLFPLLRPFRGPQSLSPGGRTGFKCVLSSGGSCGRAREQSGSPSASFGLSLLLFVGKAVPSMESIQGIAESYDHMQGCSTSTARKPDL